MSPQFLMGTASLQSHPGVNNAAGALRHAGWSAKMAQSLGVNEAKKISDAYEISHPNDRYERAMDLINNNVGRVLGEALPGVAPDEIARLALEAGLLQTSLPPAMIFHEKRK
ncbi:hypothetical protein [Mesorhizobium sp. M0618]|uniref:DUF6973 domain-containing protein n=1 Tax=unclassified Mesorhizobium TaxID=325217 RepID=UPI00333D417E